VPSKTLGWGNCTLVRNQEFKPRQVEHADWAESSMDAALIADGGDDLPILVNVHSRDKPIEGFPRAEFTAAGGLSCHQAKVWDP